MAYSPCILLCESPHNGDQRLAEKLRQAGIQVELAGDVQTAHKMLRRNFYDGAAIDLLLPEQDGISLAMDIRREHQDLPVMVLTTRHSSGKPDSVSAGPHWLDKTANHARTVFALKQASQRSAGKRPRVLHVENDDFQARLVQSTMGHQAQLVRARDATETELALLKGQYDLALVNLDCNDDVHQNALHLLETSPANLPLVINAAPGSDPRETIIWALLSQFDEPPRTAYC